MKEITAVDLRRSLAKLARAMERTGEPVLLKLRDRPIGVIVSLKDFKERFALTAALDERRRLAEEILADRIQTDVPVDEAIAELRSR